MRLGERLHDGIANRILIVDDEHAWPLARDTGRLRAGSPPVQPFVDVVLTEAPLTADADSRNLSGFDQSIDRTQVDLEIVEYFLRCQEVLVGHPMRAVRGLSRESV